MQENTENGAKAMLHPYIHRQIVILPQGTFARTAAKAMCEQNVGCVLVADLAGDLVGILTDRDLACALASSDSGAELSISEIMTPRPAYVEDSDDVQKVIRLMSESGIRRIPVVSWTSEGIKRCVGIITLDDLIARKTIDSNQLGKIVRAQMHRRRTQHYERRFSKASRPVETENRGPNLNYFYSVLAERIQMPPEALVKLTRFLLGCVIRRIHHTTAAALIARLPMEMREELLGLPIGPDAQIDRDYMLSELKKRYQFSEQQAEEVLCGFFPTLLELVNRDEMELVLSQLHEEFRCMFRPGGSRSVRKSAA
jgi:CBS domain-containing protein